MAAIAEAVHAQDRQKNRLSTWVKKLTNRKNASNDNQHHGTKKSTRQTNSQGKKTATRNNPYLASNVAPPVERQSFSTVPTGRTGSTSSLNNNSRRSFKSSQEGISPPTIGNKSLAPTIATTEHDTANSDAARSHGASSGGGTNTTIGGGMSSTRGADSTFSSPAPSVRSLTTTLTTIHSAAAGPMINGNGHHSHHTTNGGAHGTTIQFSHQFPASPIPSALPAHLQPQGSGSGGHPATYNTATANNLLTDNASILTLASSSKRRRRRSMDTDASVRALAPSSIFGGSRESLPLSVLSSNIDTGLTVSTHQPRPSVGGLNERASIYSATGIAPALPSERNSYYAGKPGLSGDAGSVHNRTDSINGSIGATASGSGGAASSPLASPREIPTPGRLSRTNSAWGDSRGGSIESSAELDKTEGEKGKAEGSGDRAPKAVNKANEATDAGVKSE